MLKRPKHRDVVVLAISVLEQKKTVKTYLKKQKLPFPVLLDKDGKIAVQYGVRAFPTHFFINGDGILIGFSMGPIDWNTNESKNLIDHLLKHNKRNTP